MKAYCAMHDKILNYSEKRWEQDVEGVGDCHCCDRPIERDYNHGLELNITEAGNLEQNVCNCFITGDGKGYYTKEQLEEHNGKITIQEMEELEKDHRLEFDYKEVKLECGEYIYVPKDEVIVN